MHTITIAALGPGSRDLLTLGALKQLQKAKTVVLRTERHGAVPLLLEEGIRFTSLDSLYQSSADFDTFARLAAAHILELAEKTAVTYAVADPLGDESVRLLREKAGDALRVLPGVPLFAPLITQSGPAAPYLVSSAVDARVYNAQQPLAVFELDSQALAGETKL